jgi:aspartyl-tRNA(Asn)/glutamyl-tRNA(Gln) amidotransferase subunit B
MRSKEDAQDYRFISDPDLLSLNFDDKYISNIKDNLPELPIVKLKKIISKYNIDEKNASILAKNLEIVEFFEKVASKIDPKFALPWVTIELLRFLNYNKTSLDKVDVKVEDFVCLLKLVKDNKITELKAKEILNKFYPKSFTPDASEGKITDSKELQKVIDKVIHGNKKAVEDYRLGEQKSFEFLMGQIMIETKKRADFKIAREQLLKSLKK